MSDASSIAPYKLTDHARFEMARREISACCSTSYHIGDWQICVPANQLSPEALEEYLAPVWSGEQDLTPIGREKEHGEPERIAEGYERPAVLTAEVKGQTVTWTEWRLVLRWLKAAQAAEEALRARLAKAHSALAALNEPGRGKKRFTAVEALLYLERDDRATGLIRLLAIGLRVLTLLEFVVRRNLAAEGVKLAGLYTGNPKRATARPTAERLLEAFQAITLTVIQEPYQTRRHLTPLSEVQQRILALLGFSTDIYARLCVDFAKPP